MRFVWDETKNASNRLRHRLSFEEVSVLFSNGREYLEIYDELHSDDEDRFIAIGAILRGVIVVVYTEPSDETVRIISARRATKREAEMFTAYMKEGRR